MLGAVTTSPFLAWEAAILNKARMEHLALFLPELMREGDLATALDVGCGALGYFTRFLADGGLMTRAIDARMENVLEARKLHPDIDFSVHDVEDGSLASMGQYDLVLCFGLLYHLENPFLAIRNLSSVTAKYLLIESQVAPAKTMGASLFEEPQVENQSLRYVVLMPSEQALVKMLYKAGFRAIYRPRQLPRHRDFSSSMARRKVRTVLLASKADSLERGRRWGQVGFRFVAEPAGVLVSPFTWHRGPAKLPLSARRVAGMLLRAVKGKVQHYRRTP